MMHFVAVGALATASAHMTVYQASADAGDASMNQLLEMDGIAFEVKDASEAPVQPGAAYPQPWVFACGVFVGGAAELKALHDSDELVKLQSCDLGQTSAPGRGVEAEEVQEVQAVLAAEKVPQPAAGVLEPPPAFDAAAPIYGETGAYPEQVQYAQASPVYGQPAAYPEQVQYAQAAPIYEQPGAYPEPVHYAQAAPIYEQPGAYPEQVHYAQAAPIYEQPGAYPEQVHYAQAATFGMELPTVQQGPAYVPDVSFGGYAQPMPAAPAHAYQSWTAPTVGYPHVEYSQVQHVPAQYPDMSFPGYAPPAPAAPQHVYQPWAAPTGLEESYAVAETAPKLFGLYGEPKAFNIGGKTFNGHRTFVDSVSGGVAPPPYR